MDFIFDNLIILIIIASGIVKWMISTKEAKEERENQPPPIEYDEQELEEFIEQAERRQARAAVPPPLPMGESQPLPGVERSPVPDLKRKSSEPPPVVVATDIEDELARQASLAEQLKGLKQAKQAPTARIARLATDVRKKPGSSSAPGSLRSRLSSSRELRQAFVVKEILEKPIGLR